MEQINTPLTRMLRIRYPIIMAPMFLVSNAKMTTEAIRAGITGAIPALNYRTDAEFRKALNEIRQACEGPIGINLIVNKSNIRLKEQLKTCLDYKVDYIITSLGNPKEVIEACKPRGIKVFCDVVDEMYAKKVEQLGADAIIAVNSEAGGHAGPTPAAILVPQLVKACRIPVISAGGVGQGRQMAEKLALGACGVSIGSPFIASHEADVSQEYKEAIVQYGAKDIVMTTKISGTPCTVINTPYVQKIGTRQNWLEALLNRNRRLKKYAKMLTFYKGMKALEQAAFGATYKTVWCAGPSIEHVHAIRPVREIVETLVREYAEAVKTQLHLA
ncbi:MAG: 2-nitropropane dioxygenase [Chitinophagales bacterium]|nr:MAG: 2-nitropropane dioxygenase [Chitinophagales bacterium]